MSERTAAEIKQPAFYQHETLTLHEDLFGDLQRPLSELTLFVGVQSIGPFIADVRHTAADIENKAKRRTMCSLNGVQPLQLTDLDNHPSQSRQLK